MESSDHLFFESDWAVSIWSKLGIAFSRRSDISKSNLISVWLNGDKHDFMDCLASAMACCALWEIWRARNVRIFDGKTRNIWLECKLWAVKFVKMIPKPFVPLSTNRFCLQVLGVKPPPFSSLPRPLWRPPKAGLGMDIAFLFRDDVCLVCGLVRDQIGAFIMAVKLVLQSACPVENCVTFIAKFHNDFPRLSAQMRRIQSSHFCFVNLSSQEDDVPTNYAEARQLIFSIFPEVYLHHSTHHE